jgi:FMN reductase
MGKIVVVMGSATPPGRFSKALTGAVEEARGAKLDVELIDLATVKLGFADGRPLSDLDDDTATVVLKLSEAGAVLFASPVYRGTLTGCLKNLLDLTPLEALRDKPCGIAAMGASLHHYLGVDHHLRDILAWFGAVTLPTSVYLTNADFVDGAPGARTRAELSALIAALAQMQAALGGQQLGPAPLAAGKV